MVTLGHLGLQFGRAGRQRVFETGVLLDGRVGFHPHTSWTDTTGAAELAFLARYAPGVPLRRVGVLRAFPTRHGPGPFPTEAELPAWAEHNTAGPWQGGVRRGWFDAVLGRYALAAVGGVDALVLTWLDAVGPTAWRACDAYTTAEGRLHDLPAPGDLAAQAALGALLAAARPVLDAPRSDPAAVVDAVGQLLGRPVTHTAAGPTATTFRRRS